MAINRDKVSASAIKHLQSGKFDRAIGELQKLVEDDPKDVRTLLKLGDTYVKVGRRDDAIASYQAVADVYSEQGFYLKAVAVFKQMLRVDGNLPAVHLQLAEMYQQLGLHSDCMQHFQQVAVYYERQGDLAKTLDVLKKMVDLDPDNLPSRIKLAELFAQQGHNDKAIQEFRSAADYLKSQDRNDDFIRVAERLVYFDPSAIDVTRELATLYLKRGDAKLALGKLQTCFKADPRNLDTLTLIAEAFLAMDQVPKTVSVYKEMARIHESTGAQAEAQRHWNRVLELVPDDGEARQALGVVSVPSPAAPVAAAPAAPSIAPPPASAPPPAPAAPAGDPEEEQVNRLLTETDVYVKYGLRDKALEHLTKVIGMRPSHIEAHDKMRDLHQQMGNRAGLVGELKLLLELGAAAGDPRLAAWERDYQLLTGAATPAPAGPPPVPVTDHGELGYGSELGSADAEVIDADGDSDAIVLDDDLEDGGLEDGGLEDGGLEDGGLGDEAMLGAHDAGLPDDEGMLEAGDDAVVLGADNEEGLLELDEGDAAAAFLDQVNAAASPAPLEVPAAVMDGELGDLDGLGDALGAELAAAAAAGIHQLSGEMPSEVGNAIEDPLSELSGVEGGDSFFDEAAFAAAASGIDGAAREAGGEEAGFASTEIMSLSPEEMAEIQAMARPAGAADAPPGFDLGDQVASGQLVTPSAEFNDFTDATQAMNPGAMGAFDPAPADGALSKSEEELLAAASDVSAEMLDPDEEAEVAAEMAAFSQEGAANDYRGQTEAASAVATMADAFGTGDLDDYGLGADGPEELGTDDIDAAAMLADAGSLVDEQSFPSDLSDESLLDEADAFESSTSFGERAAPAEEGTGDDAELLDSADLQALDDDLLGGSASDLLGVAPGATDSFAPDGAFLDSADLGSADLGSADLGGLSPELHGGGDFGGEPLEGDLTIPGELSSPLVSADGAGDPFGDDLAAAGFDADVGAPLDQSPPNEPTDPGLAQVNDDASASFAASGEAVASDEAPPEEPRKPKLGVSTSAYGFEDDPTAAFYPDELEEAEFFLNTELIDEAREILLEIQEDVENSPRVAWMLARCDAKENGEPEPPAPWAEKVLEVVEEEVGDLFDNLLPPEPDDGQVSVDEVLAQFKKGVAEQVDEGDAETHYNLGIAYREMGLVDDAIAEFQIAARAPSKAADAQHLIGLCHIDQGDHEAALVAFTTALDDDSIPTAQRGANEYQLGICYEALGRAADARAAYERAKEHGAGQQDIDARIAHLAGAGGNGSNGMSMPAAEFASDEEPGGSRKKIDYL